MFQNTVQCFLTRLTRGLLLYGTILEDNDEISRILDLSNIGINSIDEVMRAMNVSSVFSYFVCTKEERRGTVDCRQHSVAILIRFSL